MQRNVKGAGLKPPTHTNSFPPGGLDRVKECFGQLRSRQLLAAIPIEVQREGLSLAALQASLRGRRRGSCHLGEPGAALRRLGFVRQRGWSGADDFSAIWRKVRLRLGLDSRGCRRDVE